MSTKVRRYGGYKNPEDFLRYMREYQRTEMPPKLAELWGRGALLRDDTGKDDNFMPRWHRHKWSMQVSHLLQSIDNKRPPFAETGGLTPYDYRAFDLTDGSQDDDGKAILFVDIHT